jgi:hypothetical protein
MTTFVVCECGHGIEAHKKEHCLAPMRGTEGCSLEGKPIPCDCKAWSPVKTDRKPGRTARTVNGNRGLRFKPFAARGLA